MANLYLNYLLAFYFLVDHLDLGLQLLEIVEVHHQALLYSLVSNKVLNDLIVVLLGIRLRDGRHFLNKCEHLICFLFGHLVTDPVPLQVPLV